MQKSHQEPWVQQIEGFAVGVQPDSSRFLLTMPIDDTFNL
jgi:hypothetical protein